jgi:pyruvate/2-oxoacid:ferredoxin oxidoreductase beta subunit/Pyruvate/2-oxoacid:ferredoxin oxidoreductase delta subunit
MTKPTIEEHAAGYEATSQRDSSEALGPLVKEAGEAMGTHGRGHDMTVFNLDLERYVGDFNERILDSYARGTGPAELPADIGLARSLVPPGTARMRDFSHLAPTIPEFIRSQCVGCMKCVVECPDTAILGKVTEPQTLESHLESVPDANDREWIRGHWAHTRKYFDGPEKLGEEPGLFGIFIDPTKCKGCGECVTACGKHQALRMVPKDEQTVPRYRQGFELFQRLPPTPEHFIRDRILVDMMLDFEKTLLYTGGAGSCAGCGETTAIRMMLAATGYRYDRTKIGIVAATGCNTVYGSTYPYNPFLVSWTNSLFENAPAVAMGIRLRWDQQGHQDRRLWVLGGDGAMYDIGFQSLSRLLASGMDVKILVLDTQVYSNTGGQTSTASFTGQGSKMSPHGSAIPGKQETRKELARIAMMHPDCFVAQTTAAYPKHFYQSILDANEFPGPALINVYTACQPEHGIADDRAAAQAKLAVKSRAFPLLVHDPRKGERLSERLSLQGNPSLEADWASDKRTGKLLTFIDFARTEGRFAGHFDAEGVPSPTIRRAEASCLANWRLLQDLAK